MQTAGGGGCIICSTFSNLKFDFLWIKQSKDLYEIMFIFLYFFGLLRLQAHSTKSVDP